MECKGSSFVGYINHSHRELFHSRAIAWLINENSVFKKNFVKKISHIANEDIDWVLAINELEQIDILVIFRTKSDMKYRFIHIENKLKANESDKKISGKEKQGFKNESKELRNIDREIFSQTEYYFLRISLKEKIKKILNKLTRSIPEKNIEISIDQFGNKENWYFVFLTPGGDIKYTNRQINRWNSEDFSVNNPWITFSYEDLILRELKSTVESAAANEYVDYLRDQFSKNSLNFSEKKCQISKNNLAESLAGKRQILESYILEQRLIELQEKEIISADEYFDVFEKFSNDCSISNNYKPRLVNEFLKGSSNNPSYIFQSFFVFDGFNFSESQCGKIRIGYQYEQFSSRGKIKLFIAAFDYDNISLKNLDLKNLDLINYKCKCRQFMDQGLKMSLDNFFPVNNRSVGNPTSKTFISYLNDIDDFKDSDSLIMVFKERMSCLVSDLIQNINSGDLLDFFLQIDCKKA